MKTFRTTLLGLLLLAPLALTAQDDKEKSEKEREEKIDRLKIAFITTELNLTTDEAEKFWPVYNELEVKVKELKKANRKIEKEVRENYETLTDADAKAKMKTIVENGEKEAKLRREYAEKFSGIIGDKRALKLLSLEHEFRRELLDRLREQGGHKGPPAHHRDHGRH